MRTIETTVYKSDKNTFILQVEFEKENVNDKIDNDKIESILKNATDEYAILNIR